MRLTDVAREAGVSLTTASHTFNGNRPVAEATRSRVLSVAAQLGFRPLGVGRLVAVLVRPPEALPGFVFGTSSFANIAGSINMACLRHGLTVATALTLDDLSTTVRRPEGCIVMVPSSGDPVLAAAVRSGLPTVSFDPDPTSSNLAEWVGPDYEKSVARLVKHMADRGARRICAVVGTTDNSYRRGVLAGYRAGITGLQNLPIVTVASNELGADAGAAAVASLLAGTDPPDGVITSSPVFALGALRAATAAGLHVPEQIRIAAATDGPLAEAAPVPLTTLRGDYNTMAETLVESLLLRMDGQQGPAMRMGVPLELVHRAST
ncbi:LacI family DNA-binding transcriptional regulator [Streptomyces sp. NBC_00063]|uniref:LacI family DNA-binding transcriptional regulator n=1 Tax=Streptomyces sp. NBC_00063 TaxID=2975638 RepID=UPI003D72318C